VDSFPEKFRDREPYMEGQPINELGFSWESAVGFLILQTGARILKMRRR